MKITHLVRSLGTDLMGIKNINGYVNSCHFCNQQRLSAEDQTYVQGHDLRNCLAVEVSAFKLILGDGIYDDSYSAILFSFVALTEE